uniref:Alpha tocopherol transfer protein like n=1 Tax=Cyanoderma ruficeps TaxID=181631 RepID=A0A8C3R4E1_9PASS
MKSPRFWAQGRTARARTPPEAPGAPRPRAPPRGHGAGAAGPSLPSGGAVPGRRGRDAVAPRELRYGWAARPESSGTGGLRGPGAPLRASCGPGDSDSCRIMSGESDCTRTSPSAGSPSDSELLPDRPKFLRARKFDYDRALQLLVNYHTCRRTWPEVFSNLKPSAIKPVLESGFVTVLPHRDPQGRHVVCIRPDRWTPSNYPITENIRAIYLTLEKLIQSEETQVNGIVILADYKGVSLSKASHFGPFVAKKVIGILQDGFPIRIKAVNIINEPRIFKGIFAIIKPFLKEKIANRFFLHGCNLNSLHQNIPPVILPEEYGGTAGKLDISAWNELLLASEDDFLHDFSELVLPCDSSPHDLLVFV